MSDKSRNEKLIFIVLLIVFLAILLPNFLKKSSGKVMLDKVSQTISKETPPAPILPKEVNKKEETNLSTAYTVDGQKDPLGLPDAFKNAISNLVTPKEEEITLPPLVVSGVIWGGNIPQAIINGKILKEGDSIEGVEILEIKKEGVIIFYKGKEFPISVVRQVISQINSPKQ